MDTGTDADLGLSVSGSPNVCTETGVVFSRVWAMPSADTFDIPCIAGFVQKYLMKSKVSIDPFARNKRWATYTNDLNPNTAAEYHMDAGDFCKMLLQDSITADLGIFDPPYSPRQIAEVYAGIGKKVTMEDTQMVGIRRECRNALASLITENGIVLSFGWNTAGIGIKRGFETIEIMLVCHGGWHNDTICMAERRKPRESDLFDICPQGEVCNTASGKPE